MFNGERLKQAREALGLTQLDLALTANLDQSYISLIEQSARQPSDSVEEVLALSTGFPTTSSIKTKPQIFRLVQFCSVRKADFRAAKLRASGRWLD